jgi:Ca2+-binding RTX toxin-like protein
MLRRAFLLSLVLAALWPASAHAIGTFSFDPATSIVTFKVDDQAEQSDIAIFATQSTLRLVNFGTDIVGPGAGCAFVGSGTNPAVDCPLGVSRIVLQLGNDNDVASVNPNVTVPVTFNGGGGNDGLFGGGGVDTFDGGPGDDNIVSRDGRAEEVDCGTGHDTAISDDSDTRSSCEEVQGDADRDGVRFPADCDDTNPAIHPGAVDIPDDGIDQNCDGVDATNLDRDHDGFPRPQDCDDTNAAIHPGAIEKIGNAVDENCDGIIAPFPPLTGSISGTWRKVGNRTRNLTLQAKGFPHDTVITVRCTGSGACPKTVKKTVRRAHQVLNLHVVLGRRALPKKARLVLSVTHARRIGRELHYSLATPGLPSMEFLCKPPGSKAGPC